MTKKSEPEGTPAESILVDATCTLTPAEAAAFIQPAERSSDKPQAKSARHKGKAANAGPRPSRRMRTSALPRRRGHGHDRASLLARRPPTQSVAPADHRRTADTKVGGEANLLSLTVQARVEGDVSRTSLTAEFFAGNGKSVEGTIQRGHAIQQSKDRLPHGQFTPWLVEDLRLGERKTALSSAAMYMQIAQNPVTSDPNMWKFLPCDYRSLWELTHIRPDEVLIEHINAGRVHHNMRRKDCEHLKIESLGRWPIRRNRSRRRLPLPEFPELLQPLLDGILQLHNPKVVAAYVNNPSDLNGGPSDEEIDEAVAYLKVQRSSMRGER